MENITELQNEIDELSRDIRRHMSQIEKLENEYDYKVSIRNPHMKVGTQTYITYNNDLNFIEHKIELLWSKIKQNRAKIGEFDLKISEIKLKNNKNVDYSDTTKRNCKIIDGKFCYYNDLTELPREKLMKDASTDFHFCNTFAGKSYEAYYSNGTPIYKRIYSLIHDVKNESGEFDTIIAKDVKSVNRICVYFVKNNPAYRIEIDLISGKKQLCGFKTIFSYVELDSFNEEQRDLIKKAIKIIGDESCYKEEVELLKGLL